MIPDVSDSLLEMIEKYLYGYMKSIVNQHLYEEQRHCHTWARPDPWGGGGRQGGVGSKRGPSRGGCQPPNPSVPMYVLLGCLTLIYQIILWILKAHSRARIKIFRVKLNLARRKLWCRWVGEHNRRWNFPKTLRKLRKLVHFK